MRRRPPGNSLQFDTARHHEATPIVPQPVNPSAIAGPSLARSGLLNAIRQASSNPDAGTADHQHPLSELPPAAAPSWSATSTTGTPSWAATDPTANATTDAPVGLPDPPASLARVPAPAGDSAASVPASSRSPASGPVRGADRRTQPAADRRTQPADLTPEPAVLTPEPAADRRTQPADLTPEPAVLTPEPTVLTPEPTGIAPKPAADRRTRPANPTPQPAVLTPQPNARFAPEDTGPAPATPGPVGGLGIPALRPGTAPRPMFGPNARSNTAIAPLMLPGAQATASQTRPARPTGGRSYAASGQPGAAALSGGFIPGQWQVGDDDIMPTDGRKGARPKIWDRYSRLVEPGGPPKPA